jgi:excisionase family DNA binding protein
MNADNQTEPLFVRLSEAARLLSMSRSAAYEAMKAGVIPSVRIAGKWRIPRAALDKFVNDAMKSTGQVEVPSSETMTE